MQERERAERFALALARELRFWLAALPAGVGLATLRAGVKSWIGFPPARSGVFSAGNGPAMRAPLLGACLGHDLERLRAFVRASTRITHTDERAYEGALAIAVAAAQAMADEDLPLPARALAAMRASAGDAELHRLLVEIETALTESASAEGFAARIGAAGGVSGFVYQTVPVALYCWLRHPASFRDAVESVIALGGDTDTTAAIVGALAGATLGRDAIPSEWIAGLIGPPSVAEMEQLARGLSAGTSEAPSWPWLRQAFKNAVLLPVVLAHGFRRLVPLPGGSRGPSRPSST